MIATLPLPSEAPALPEGERLIRTAMQTLRAVYRRAGARCYFDPEKYAACPFKSRREDVLMGRALFMVYEAGAEIGFIERDPRYGRGAYHGHKKTPALLEEALSRIDPCAVALLLITQALRETDSVWAMELLSFTEEWLHTLPPDKKPPKPRGPVYHLRSYCVRTDLERFLEEEKAQRDTDDASEIINELLERAQRAKAAHRKTRRTRRTRRTVR